RDGGELADELAAALDRDWEVKRFTDADALIGDVEDGAVAFGVALPDRYTERVLAGESVEIEDRGPPNDLNVRRRNVVEAAVAEQAAVARAALFASNETGASVADARAAAEAAQATLPEIEVEVETIGESLFPEELAGFALGAQGQLVLFIFITSLTGSAQL